MEVLDWIGVIRNCVWLFISSSDLNVLLDIFILFSFFYFLELKPLPFRELSTIDWLIHSLICSFLFIGSLKKQIILLDVCHFVIFLFKVFQLWSICLSSAANLRLEHGDLLPLQLFRDRSVVWLIHWVKIGSFYFLNRTRASKFIILLFISFIFSFFLSFLISLS